MKRDSSLRKPTASRERAGSKKRRLAPFGMTVGEHSGEGTRRGGCPYEIKRAGRDAGATREKERRCRRVWRDTTCNWPHRLLMDSVL